MFFLILTLIVSIGFCIFDYFSLLPPKGRGTVVAEYKPPADMTPLQVAVFLYKTINKDIFISEIFYLASKGYIILNKSSNGYVVKKSKPSDKALEEPDSLLLKYLFKNRTEVNTKDLVFPGNNQRNSASIYDIAKLAASKGKNNELLDDLAQNFSFDWHKVYQAGLTANERLGYTSHWLGLRKGMIMIAGFLLYFPLPFVGHLYTWPAATILLAYGILRPNITKKGAVMKEYLKGYKEYLNTVEKDRLRMLSSPDSELTSFPVELAYAVALNVNNEWSSQFSS